MAKKPPRARRRVNSDVSVDLSVILTELSRALGRKHDETGPALGLPGSYATLSGTSDTPGGFAVSYLFSEIMSKFDDESKESDARKTIEALSKFREAELLCSDTNRYFDKVALYPESVTPPDTDPDVWQAMCLARRKIETLLGAFNWNEAAERFRFTTGASFGMPRTRSAPAHKYSKALEITPDAEPLAQAAFRLNPAWGAAFCGEAPDDLPVGETFPPGCKVVEGNRVLCVPKNYKVHRVIAAEPSGNVYFQKGIGYALRRRLQAVHIDITNQQQNRDWAHFGSVTGLVGTIDLSMASDTVSKGIVEWAIPPDWVSAMSLCRSPVGVLPDGSKVLYRKWSSMGNAYNFELETLIFWGLTFAATHLSGHDTRFISVYGDDIIAPAGAWDLLRRVLRRCGFVPNEKKTFVSGPFRESCGIHNFHGADVTPFYIRRPLKKLTDLFLLVNNIRRWVWRMRAFLTEEQYHRCEALVARLRSYAPSDWRRPRIPDGIGNGAFIGTFDECLPARPHGKWLWQEGWQVEVISDTRKAITRVEDDGYLTISGVMLAMLENLELGHLLTYDDWLEELVELDPSRGSVVPNRTKRFELTTQIVTQW